MVDFSRKRVLSAALAALLCLTTLSACAGDAGNEIPSATTAPGTVTTAADTSAEIVTTAQPEETRISPDLPAADFGGHKFNVLTRGQFSETWYSRDIYAEGITGEVINDAVYKRNKKIEQQYNFEVVEIGSNDAGNDAKNSILAQNDAYDMLCFKIKDHITSLILQGMLLDLNQIELLNLDQPYYDQNSRTSLSMGHKLFCVTGDLLTMDNDATRCVLFNQPLFQNLQLSEKIGGSLYDAVDSGRWTLDMLELCSTAASADLNGDQRMDLSDQWGMAGMTFEALALFNSCGMLLFEKDTETDLPKFTANTERCLSALERIIPMLHADHTLLYSNVYTEAHPNFKEGRILFHLAQLAEVTIYRAMEIDFGIIPLPKYDEGQERYYSPVTTYGSNCIAIPITASNLDRTATIIEALSCESMYTVTDAYYETALKGKMLRDKESTEMLDLILGTTVFELGYMWNWGSIYNTLYSATNANNPNLAAPFKTLERVMDRTLKSTIDAVEKAQ